jgi:NADH-quinone oxidoreductase subunit N
MAIVAAVCVLAGIGFKVTAFPFHFYAPDVYQAGPTGVVAALATAPKVAGFLAIFRVFGEILAPVAQQGDHAFSALYTTVPLMVFLLAAASMTFGNVLALLQENIRRMLAYSGVAHAGYMLVGLAAAGAGVNAETSTVPAAGAVVFYLGAYGLMTLGAFAALAAVGTEDRPVTTIDDLAGLAKDRPLAAFALAVALLSMIGLPLTAGFSGKLLLFLSAWNAPTNTPMGHLFRILLAIAAVNAAVGAVYYLRALGAMYLRGSLVPFTAKGSKLALLAALLCAFGTLFFGVYSKPLSNAVQKVTPVQVRTSGPS